MFIYRIAIIQEQVFNSFESIPKFVSCFRGERRPPSPIWYATDRRNSTGGVVVQMKEEIESVVVVAAAAAATDSSSTSA